MVDVGVILPQDVITGETVASFVNPGDCANIPGLHVVKDKFPMWLDAGL